MAVDAARAKSLFLVASDLADPAERAAYLDRECGDDAELRGRVEALLRANDASPLPPPATDDATVDSDPGSRRREPTDMQRPQTRSRSVASLDRRPIMTPPPNRTCSSPADTRSNRRSAKGAWARSGSPSNPSRSSVRSP